MYAKLGPKGHQCAIVSNCTDESYKSHTTRVIAVKLNENWYHISYSNFSIIFISCQFHIRLSYKTTATNIILTKQRPHGRGHVCG